jgi:hypothetical protein
MKLLQKQKKCGHNIELMAVTTAQTNVIRPKYYGLHGTHHEEGRIYDFLLFVIYAGGISFFPSDEQIKKEIIQQWIRSYPGNCPCPYNLDRAGRRCGKRSAYSKPGGYSPICYPSNVTEQIIANHKKRK